MIEHLTKRRHDGRWAVIGFLAGNYCAVGNASVRYRNTQQAAENAEEKWIAPNADAADKLAVRADSLEDQNGVHG